MTASGDSVLGRRELDPAIEVLAGTDVDDAWDRFEVFEALHHSLQICNPLSDEQLDEAIAACELAGGESVLDIACGYGESLIRCAERHHTTGVGIDLSPWMISTASERAAARVQNADLRWIVGDASRASLEPADVVICTGAEWVWHDVAGTAREVAELLRPGGVAMIGAGRLHLDADQKVVANERGAVESVDDIEAIFATRGLRVQCRVDPDDADWDRYLASTKVAVGEWATQLAGPRSQQWVADQAEWQAARDRDRGIMGWSVWVLRCEM